MRSPAVRPPSRTPHSALAAVLVTTLLATGCAVGGDPAGDGDRADRARDAGVGERNHRARPAGHHRRHEPRGKRRTKRSGGSGHGESAGDDAVPDGPARSAPAAPSWMVLATGTDPRGDHGRGPAYADVTGLDLREDGSRLRVDVTVAGVVPARLGDGEVAGVGIDLYRGSGTESDYQVFLDGGAHGWRGYLQAPDGFVAFPGSVAVSGKRLTVILPWSAVGGRSAAEVSVFCDWSSSRVLSDASSDVVPGGGRSSIRPA